MSYTQEDDKSPQYRVWQRERQAMTSLSSLSDRTGERSRYLYDIVCASMRYESAIAALNKMQ